MRRWLAIAWATALEILSEPLSLLVLIAALVLATLTPAFHYHQFGEATRMARDAGLSAFFLGSLVIAVFGSVRSLRREIETGTIQMALSHPVSRTAFFLSKTLGAAVATGIFATILAAVSLTIVNGAALGGAVADRSGDIARLWGPSFALGVATLVLPLLAAAALNRFAGFRFVLSAVLLSLFCALAGTAYRFDRSLAVHLLPVFLLAALPLGVFLAAASAAAVRFGTNGASAAVGLVIAGCLPALGNYYLPDALSRGGVLPWPYVLLAFAAVLPVLLAFLLLGVHFINGRDLT